MSRQHHPPAMSDDLSVPSSTTTVALLASQFLAMAVIRRLAIPTRSQCGLRCNTLARRKGKPQTRPGHLRSLLRGIRHTTLIYKLIPNQSRCSSEISVLVLKAGQAHMVDARWPKLQRSLPWYRMQCLITGTMRPDPAALQKCLGQAETISSSMSITSRSKRTDMVPARALHTLGAFYNPVVRLSSVQASPTKAIPSILVLTLCPGQQCRTSRIT